MTEPTPKYVVEMDGIACFILKRCSDGCCYRRELQVVDRSKLTAERVAHTLNKGDDE